MKLAGLVGKLLVGWGGAGLIASSMTHDRGYPAATWLLVYLGLGFMVVGGVMWWQANAVQDLPESADRTER
jgi:hypothetical protein